MPTGGPFPTREPELNSYFIAVVPYLMTNKVRLHVSDTNIALLDPALSDWTDYYNRCQNTGTRTQDDVDAKNAAKINIQNLLRSIYDDIPQSALTTADRSLLHLPERAAPHRAPVPDTHPIAEVNTSERLRHTISFMNSDGSRAKPAHVRGCQIWHFVGEEAPADFSSYEYLATDSATPYTAVYNGALAGKKVFYVLRWENTRGETGPWSETVMATITA